MTPGLSRRSFLAAAGLVGGMGALSSGRRDGADPRIRFWLSPDAASYGDRLPIALRTYLEHAVSPVFDEVEISFGGVVDVSTEDGYGVFGGEDGWAERVTAGFLGRGGVRSVDGVNLLVTDGAMSTAPTGAALRGAATVGGARHLLGLPNVREITPVMPFSYPLWVMQVVIHECGHALGLAHDHGGIEIDADRVIVTPMVSSYAWADEELRARQFDYEYSACGDRYRSVGDRRRYLSLGFSSCATARLRCWNAGVLPKNGLTGCCSACLGPRATWTRR